METNSLVNYMDGRSKYPDPVVGMGATRLMYTDRKPLTIVEVLRTKSGTLVGVKVQEDNARRIDSNGMSESQEYEYSPNPEAAVRIYTLRGNGAFVLKARARASRVASASPLGSARSTTTSGSDRL